MNINFYCSICVIIIFVLFIINSDELARKGTTIDILQENDTIRIPIVTCRLFIKQRTLRQAE